MDAIDLQHAGPAVGPKGLAPYLPVVVAHYSLTTVPPRVPGTAGSSAHLAATASLLPHIDLRNHCWDAYADLHDLDCVGIAALLGCSLNERSW